MIKTLKNYLVEFIGTFFLVFTVCSTILFGGTGIIPAIAIGFALMIMVYAGGHISGGHYNPAVSLAAAIRGALPFSKLWQYWLAQILGGSFAAFLALQFSVNTPTETTCPYSKCAIIAGEFLFTFALCYVVLLTATTKKTQGNSYYGLAIGSTVIVGAFAVGGTLCFGAFNPAVAVALGVINAACIKCITITVITNLIAAILAAITFKLVAVNDEE